MQRVHYVYELVKPDGATFYVGRSQHGTFPRKRGHILEALHGYPSRKCDIIREILSNGEDFTENIVYETEDEIDAIHAEWFMIYRVHGVKNLTNAVHYNPGPVQTSRRWRPVEERISSSVLNVLSANLGRRFEIDDVSGLNRIDEYEHTEE